MMDMFEMAKANADLLVSNLEKLSGNEHPDRKYGHFVLGMFNVDSPNRLALESAEIGNNPLPEKRTKYAFLAHEKAIGNISYWRDNQDLTALSRAPTVDEGLLRYLGSALTIADDGRGVVSAFSGHPEGKVDEAISALVNYSIGLASENQLIQISEMSSNQYIASMLELCRTLNIIS